MIHLTSDLSESFFIRTAGVAQRLGCDPFDLLMPMYSESEIRANAHNPDGDASGIFQAMPATLRGLGWTHGDAAFRQLPADEQILPYVEAYFRPHAFRIGVAGQKIPQLITAVHVYTVMFLPARLQALVAAGDDIDGVIMCDGHAGGLLSWTYKPNAGLDADHNGDISAGDLAAHLNAVCKGPRWDEICSRMYAAVAPPPAA